MHLRSLLLVCIQFGIILILIMLSGLISSNLILDVMKLLAILLGFWAVFVMQFNVNVFPEVKDSQKLFMNGPYKYIRHPMYSAVLLFCFALVLDSISFLKLILWMILFGVLYLKIQLEEEGLVKKFSSYSEYMKKTYRIFPFVF